MDGQPPKLFFRLLLATAVLTFIPIGLARIGYQHPVAEWGLWGLAHPYFYGALWVAVFALLLWVGRLGLHVWFNHIFTRLSNTHAREVNYSFPFQEMDLMRELGARHRAYQSLPRRTKAMNTHDYLLGKTPHQSFSKPSQPFFISEQQRGMHVQCIGYTGTGKTQSVLLPLLLQDCLMGKGLLYIDPKASNENLFAVVNIARQTGRLGDLKVFSLSFPELSHTYNPLWLDGQDDPLAASERVFSVLQTEMEEPFYRGQSEIFFRNIVRLMRSVYMGNQRVPFNFFDILACLQDAQVLKFCCRQSRDKEAVHVIQAQFKNLGNDALKCLAGLQANLERYSHRLLNAYNPDIVFDDVLQRNQIVYFQLPSAYYGQLSAAIGKMVLQHVQQAGAKRQIYRNLNQRPFSVFIDECYNFPYANFITSLNTSRDANIQYFLAHQSFSDLERVSPEYADGVWDNTRTKVILYLNNPVLCERISKSIGTYQTAKATTQKSVKYLGVKVSTGEQSEREVEEFYLHPNYIKNLAKNGQAYVIHGQNYQGINLGRLPGMFFEPPEPLPQLPKKPAANGLGLRSLVLPNVNLQSGSGEKR